MTIVPNIHDEILDTTISCNDTIDEFISRADWRVNENANVGYSNSALVQSTAGKVIANYWLNKVYSADEGEAHRDGDYHIHDLSHLAMYCAGWSLRVLLDEGFNGAKGTLSSKPPKRLREALGQMANFLGILQSECAGAQAFSSFDTYLAPYIFREQLNYDEVRRAVTQFIYNMNVPSRWGQTPFTNITFDIKVPEDLAKNYPTIRTEHLFKDIDDEDLLELARERDFTIVKLTDMNYSHFEPEMTMILKAYYEVMTKGDAQGQPFTFPIPTVNITEDFDWNSDASNIIFENTAKFGMSYFQNFLGSQYKFDEHGNKIEDKDAYKPNAVRSMCCRLQLDLRELQKRGGGLFGSAEMTGSIGVVTINMARLGYTCKGNKGKLLNELAKLMDMASSTLEKKRKFIQEMYERGLYPYTARYLPHFRNHFSTIGINGVNEMITNFSNGKEDVASEVGEQLAVEVLDFMRERMKFYQEKTGNLYNLEATPAEGTTYRLAKADQKKYGSAIMQAGKGENIYYTNSSQLPAYYTDDPFEALEKQDRLQTKYTGGTVLHLYMSERISSGEACKKLVKTSLEKHRLPYLTITPIFSICPEHGYLNGEQHECPECGEKTQAWTRVMGYFRPVDRFNIGKKGEHNERRFFTESRANARMHADHVGEPKLEEDLLADVAMHAAQTPAADCAKV
ncbi:MAG: ribonucleoside triphosphate reductase [Proteobacteria bacterium]|nr:ribonucleoside triphosphate reductase [Pseudomonadota bacterium]